MPHRHRNATQPHGPSPLLSLALLVLAFVAFSLSGHGQSARADDKKAPALESGSVHDIISRQLDAIRTRNADQAFVTTTGALHEKYEDAAKFLDDLRFTHRSLYNHEHFRFLDQIPLEDGLLQKVEIDSDKSAHEPVLVIYRLKKDSAGHWLIDSFTVLDEDGGKDI